MTKDLSSLSRWLNIKEEESANGISLQQLESGLKAIESKLTEKEALLAELISNDGKGIEVYLNRVRAMRAEWRPVELELLKEEVYGNPTALSLESLNASLKELSMMSSKAESSYLRYLEEALLQQAKEIAIKPDYDKVSRTFATTVGSHPVSTMLVVSKKTNSLLETFERLSLATDKVDTGKIKDLQVKCANAYLTFFSQHFADQIKSLPHLCALFYNDHGALKLFLGVPSLYSNGMSYLDSMFEAQLKSMNRFCNDQLWSSCQGKLSPETVNDAEESLRLGSLHIKQLVKNLAPILDSDTLAPKIVPFVEFLYSWIWNGLVDRLKSVTKEALPELVRPITFLQSLQVGITLPPSESIERFHARFDTVIRMCSMNLIQVCNAYRRDEFTTIDVDDFGALVTVFYPDSAMRRAFLQEIDFEQ